MADKMCAKCGELNPAESNFCSNCGSSEFKDVPPRLSARLGTAAERAVTFPVRLSLVRVALVSILSFGLYIFYWFYLTWKQLADETREDHYPVWHALSLLVPIYSYFRMHRHMAVIEELAADAGLWPSLSAGWAVVLWVVINGLVGVVYTIAGTGAATVLAILGVGLRTALVVWAQGSLNQYWKTVKGANLREARLGVGEVVFVLFGLFLWVGTFVAEQTSPSLYVAHWHFWWG